MYCRLNELTAVTRERSDYCSLPASVAFWMSTGLNLLFDERKEDIQKAAIVLAERANMVFTIARCC